MMLVVFNGQVGFSFGWMLLTIGLDGVAAYLTTMTVQEVRAGYEARLAMARRELDNLRLSTRT
jgi:hypothetical protein